MVASGSQRIKGYRNPARTRYPRLDGSFWQLQSAQRTADPAQINAELAAFSARGMTHIIINYLEHQTVTGGAYTYFEPDLDGSWNGAWNDLPEIIFTYADAHGITVYCGLSDTVDNKVTRNQAVAAAAYARYGHHTSFGGFYIPPEIGDNQSTAASWGADYQSIAATCKGLAASLPVIVAPYYSLAVSATTLAAYWNTLLGIAVDVDVVAMQDSVGGAIPGANVSWQTKTTLVAGDLALVKPYFAELGPVCRANGVALWCDLEVFLYNGTAYTTVSWANRVRYQMEAVFPHVEKITCFDWYHYGSPVSGGLGAANGAGSAALHNDYVAYLATLPGP